VVRRFLSYLYDTGFASEVEVQEKKRFDAILTDLTKAVEDGLGVDRGSVSQVEIKLILPKALKVWHHDANSTSNNFLMNLNLLFRIFFCVLGGQIMRTPLLRVTLANRAKWLGIESDKGMGVVLDVPRREKTTNWQVREWVMTQGPSLVIIAAATDILNLHVMAVVGGSLHSQCRCDYVGTCKITLQAIQVPIGNPTAQYH